MSGTGSSESVGAALSLCACHLDSMEAKRAKSRRPSSATPGTWPCVSSTDRVQSMHVAVTSRHRDRLSASAVGAEVSTVSRDWSALRGGRGSEQAAPPGPSAVTNAVRESRVHASGGTRHVSCDTSLMIGLLRLVGRRPCLLGNGSGFGRRGVARLSISLQRTRADTCCCGVSVDPHSRVDRLRGGQRVGAQCTQRACTKLGMPTAQH
jgi:hypothetical protein